VRADSGALNGNCSSVLETTSRLRVGSAMRPLTATLEQCIAVKPVEVDVLAVALAQVAG